MRFITHISLLLLWTWSARAQQEVGVPVCGMDIGECEDGSTVVRVPPFCEFEACPNGGCTLDLGFCPDGSTVSRVPPDCLFADCPGNDACTTDVLVCSDGTTLGRQPPDCEFPECPPDTATPTESPSSTPTVPPMTPSPTPQPTDSTEAPTVSPSQIPTKLPTSEVPSMVPSVEPSSRPSTQPSDKPSGLVTPQPSSLPSSASTMVDCSNYQHQLQVPGLENAVTLEYVVNMNYTTAMSMMDDDEAEMVDLKTNTTTNSTNYFGTISIRVTVQGQAWIGFGFSPNGFMVGSDAVIGIPPSVPMLMDGASSSSSSGKATVGFNVGKYLLTFDYNNTGYYKLPPAQQTLMNYSITQNQNSTVLKFTRYLREVNETGVNGTGFNYFLVAYGTSNELGYHGAGRSSFNLTLSPCGWPDEDEDEDDEQENLAEPSSGDKDSPKDVPTLQGTAGSGAVATTISKNGVVMGLLSILVGSYLFL